MIKIALLINVITMIVMATEIFTEQDFPPFARYVETFHKLYKSPQQYKFRQQIYNKNIRKTVLLAAQLQIPARANKFTDRTQIQLAQMKNSRLRPLQKSVTPHQTINRKLGGPSSLDWRTKGKVSSVKDQGPCGSCWAFATAAYCQSSLMINNNQKNPDLSQQYLLQCTQQSDCKGGFPAYALLQVVNNGIPKQQTFPYNPAVTHSQICSTRKTTRIKGRQVYVYFSLSDLQMIYLLQTSPIIVGVASQGWEIYTGGVMKCKERANINEDHAVLLVGYTREYWIVKNQWGPDWGENGFVRITRNKEYNCLMGAEVDVLGEWAMTAWAMLMGLLIFVVSS